MIDKNMKIPLQKFDMRLKVSTIKKLRKLAEKKDRSVSYIAREMIETGLGEKKL